MKPEHYSADRYACDALQDLRDMHKHRDYSRLVVVTEELQRYYNNMENALHDRRNLKNLREELKATRKELKKARKKLAKKTGKKQDTGRFIL